MEILNDARFLAAVLTGIITLFIFYVKHKFDRHSKLYQNWADEQKFELQQNKIQLKRLDIELTAELKNVETLTKRFEDIHEAITEFKSIYRYCRTQDPPFKDETIQRALHLGEKIKTLHSPAGTFGEEYVTQIGQIEHYILTGDSKVVRKGSFIGSFELNTYALIDIYFEQLKVDVKRKKLIKRVEKEPFKIQN